MELIQEYFPNLSKTQIDLFSKLPSLYEEWNEKINVISRKDIENFTERHLLHSLAIGKFVKFKPETTCLDLGTGGGLPGIPLAILFPEVKFTLIDGTAKKIKVANEIIEALGIQNVKAYHKRAEDVTDRYDFVLARAVTRLNKLLPLASPLIKSTMRNAIPNGLITLKGGDLKEEISEINLYSEVVSLQEYFKEEFFAEKHLVYVPVIR